MTTDKLRIPAPNLQAASALFAAHAPEFSNPKALLHCLERGRQAPTTPAPLPAGEPPSPDKLYSFKAAGALLGLSRRSVFVLAEKGELPRVKLSPRCSRIRQADLLAYITRHTITAAPAEGR